MRSGFTIADYVAETETVINMFDPEIEFSRRDLREFVRDRIDTDDEPADLAFAFLYKLSFVD